MRRHRALPLLWAGVTVVLLAAPPALGTGVEERAKKLEGKLMAPCCMANTLAEHESGPSTRMRREIRAMLAAGRSEREILDHYVGQYGPQILSAPEAKGFGLTAYLVPFVLLVGGAVLMYLALRRWAAMRTQIAGPTDEPAQIDPEHLARLERDLQKLD